MAMMLAGGLVGVGLALVVAGLRAPAPDLAAAVTRMTSFSTDGAPGGLRGS